MANNLSGSGAVFTNPEGVSGSPTIATFTDGTLSDTPASFIALVDWGDGSPVTAGTVTGSNGSFTVSGPHAYADEGDFTTTITVTRTTDNAQITMTGTGTIAEADSLTAHMLPAFAVEAGQTFSRVLATFTDTDTTNTAADFTATLDWGDLTPDTAGTVTGGNGSFTVSGSHSYTTARGSGSVHVTLADDAPGTAHATTIAPINVNAVPFDLNGDAVSDLVFQNNGQPGIWLWNGSAPTEEAALFNPGPSWHIVASADVSRDGNADLIWQNNDGTPGIWLMNGTTVIGAAALTNPGPSWKIVAAGDVDGDGNADLIWQNTDGALGVWQMVGTKPITAVGLGSPGADWKVVGAADYNGDGLDDILLQNTTTGNLMVDLMKGTSIVSTASVTVGDPSWHAVSTDDFNGQAAIAWQNNNGTVGLWLMNGTTPVAEAALSNPGAGWQLLSVGHFTPNGQPDLLFQNSNGAMMLWQMNGTSIAAQASVLGAGTGWQSVNGHPFAAG